MGYANSPLGYANPDAVTQIANGLSTTTFTYDNNGNVTQKTVDGTTTTQVTLSRVRFSTPAVTDAAASVTGAGKKWHCVVFM